MIKLKYKNNLILIIILINYRVCNYDKYDKNQKSLIYSARNPTYNA